MKVSTIGSVENNHVFGNSIQCSQNSSILSVNASEKQSRINSELDKISTLETSEITDGYADQIERKIKLLWCLYENVGIAVEKMDNFFSPIIFTAFTYYLMMLCGLLTPIILVRAFYIFCF